MKCFTFYELVEYDSAKKLSDYQSTSANNTQHPLF